MKDPYRSLWSLTAVNNRYMFIIANYDLFSGWW